MINLCDEGIDCNASIRSKLAVCRVLGSRCAAISEQRWDEAQRPRCDWQYA